MKELFSQSDTFLVPYTLESVKREGIDTMNAIEHFDDNTKSYLFYPICSLF